MGRIEELQKLGAGDETCFDCLKGGNPPMETCRQCIASTPALTQAVHDLMQAAEINPRPEGDRT
ncbi:MAG: hypothetical protein BWY31_02400 [Lentisphaerae bacterium ADurb.Bin242]|nr:MAG: hypothetical protein BWY31_02400 [Lentisphaerae bacterium ADurb.Bin242]